MMTEIRNARAGDVAQLQEIFDLSENLAKLERYSDQRLLDEIESSTSMFLVASDEGRLGGFIWVSNLMDMVHGPKVEEFACNPTGMGVGTRLLEQALLNLCHRKCQLVWLAVACDNEGAIRFYKRFGFQQYQRKAAIWKRRTGDLADACLFRVPLGPVCN